MEKRKRNVSEEHIAYFSKGKCSINKYPQIETKRNIYAGYWQI